MGVKMRQAIEKEIAEQIIKDALAAGYVVGVEDGEDETVKGTDFKLLSEALMTSDEHHLFIYPAGDTSKLNDYSTRIGWVYLVYGNDGWDVVNDYTVNLEPIMQNADSLASKYGD